MTRAIGDIARDSTTGLALADINSDGRFDVQNPRDRDGEDLNALPPE